MANIGSVLFVAGIFCAGIAACSVGPTDGSKPGNIGNDGQAQNVPAAGRSPAGNAAISGNGVQATDSGVTARAAGMAGGTAASNLPAVTLHLAGDSTVSNYAPTTVQEGWGQEIGQFFNDRVTVDNKAIGGANVQTFKAGNWNKIMAGLKAGDYVMMQFGANDSGTAHGPVTPADFAATLEQMADEVKARGATPIFVTPSAFYQWSGGKEDNGRLAPYAAACYTAGAARNVMVDDLNAQGVAWLNAIGQTAAADFYLPARGAPDKAHFVKSGATKMAELVVEELRRNKSPLAEYLK